jgi:uncharacterized membrane protein
MESKIKVLGHALHPLMIPFPLGLLGTAVIFDVLGEIGQRPELRRTSHQMIAAGVLSGMAAAVVGTVDGVALPGDTRAKQVAIQHGLGNAGVLALFGLAWWLRRDDPEAASPGSLGLELAGLGGAAVTGWLGGELVNRHGVGVHTGAHLDAPNSLSGRPATDTPRAVAD